MISSKFVVPSIADYPENTWGLKLGGITNHIKNNKTWCLKRDELLALGFTFNTVKEKKDKEAKTAGGEEEPRKKARKDISPPTSPPNPPSSSAAAAAPAAATTTAKEKISGISHQEAEKFPSVPIDNNSSDESDLDD
jgi:hypothetical protein